MSRIDCVRKASPDGNLRWLGDSVAQNYCRLGVHRRACGPFHQHTEHKDKQHQRRRERGTRLLVVLWLRKGAHLWGQPCCTFPLHFPLRSASATSNILRKSRKLGMNMHSEAVRADRKAQLAQLGNTNTRARNKLAKRRAVCGGVFCGWALEGKEGARPAQCNLAAKA